MISNDGMSIMSEGTVNGTFHWRSANNFKSLWSTYVFVFAAQSVKYESWTWSESISSSAVKDRGAGAERIVVKDSGAGVARPTSDFAWAALPA